MKRIPQATYRTPAEIEQHIRQREDEAMRLQPATDEHRAIMKEIAQLRVYAEVKRLFGGPARQQAQGALSPRSR
jgi:hypothetical protein